MGCNDKKEYQYSRFEHYNLNEKDIIPHIYIDDNIHEHIYAIADITPDDHEIFVYSYSIKFYLTIQFYLLKLNQAIENIIRLSLISYYKLVY